MANAVVLRDQVLVEEISFNYIRGRTCCHSASQDGEFLDVSRYLKVSMTRWGEVRWGSSTSIVKGDRLVALDSPPHTTLRITDSVDNKIYFR